MRTIIPSTRRRVAAIALILLLAATGLAGCMGSATVPGGMRNATGPANAAAGGNAHGRPVAQWSLDCPHDWEQSCLHAVTQSPGSKTEPWIAINPTNPQNVILGMKDGNPSYHDQCGWTTLWTTVNGGREWVEVQPAGAFADRSPGDATYGYACATDPNFMFDAEGTAYFVLEMAVFGVNYYPLLDGLPAPEPLMWKFVLYTSSDGGRTWAEKGTVFESPTKMDYGRLAANPKTGTVLHTAHQLSAGTGCMVTRISSGGNDIGHPTRATIDEQPIEPICNNVAFSPAGIGIVWFYFVPIEAALANDNEAYRTSIARSADDGETWLDWSSGFDFRFPSPNHVPNSEHRAGKPFELDYDTSDGPRRGTLYVAYHDWNGHDFDVFVRSSADDGRTWSDPHMVHGPNATQQYTPNLAVAGDGTIHVVFMDRSADATDQLNHVVWTRSDDGGVTWTDTRVTDVPWDGDLGVHQTGIPFMADYVGIDAVGRDVWAGVPDASDGLGMVGAAFHALLECPLPGTALACWMASG